MRWNEPKSGGVNRLASLLYVPKGKTFGRQCDGSSGDPQRHLGSDLPILSFKNFYEPFQSHLKVFCLESDHSGRIPHALTEVHSHCLSTVYEEWMDYRSRDITTQQGLLLFGGESDS